MYCVYRIYTFPKYLFKRGFRKKSIVAFSTLFSIFILYYVFQAIKSIYSITFKCSFKDVQAAVTSICDSYYSNLSYGNMCSSLCITGNLRPVKCIAHHSGKEIVFEAEWNSNRVVVKSSYSNISKFEQVYWIEPKTDQKLYPELPIFVEMLTTTIEKNLRINLTPDQKSANYLITKLWTLNYKQFLKQPEEQLHIAMNNIFQLVQQPEYLLSKFYDNKNVFPKVLGSCGHAFTVEYFQPLDNYFSVLYPHWRHSFYKRTLMALKIINFVEKLQSEFEKPLHLCDVKMSHFGFSDEGEVVFIDLDMVFSEEALIENLQANSCQDDCSFIHCQGLCNQKTRFCSEKILNNNLQRVCDNILHGFTWKMSFGLLGGVPDEYYNDIYQFLNSCHNQNTSDTKMFSSILRNIIQSITAPEMI